MHRYEMSEHALAVANRNDRNFLPMSYSLELSSAKSLKN